MAASRSGFAWIFQGPASCCESFVGASFSRDGKRWQPAPGDFDFLSDTAIDSWVGAVAGWRNGFIAVGGQRLRLAPDDPAPGPDAWRVWLSPDGRRWPIVPGDPAFGRFGGSEIAVAGERIVLAGIQGNWDEHRSAMTWTSTDARAWRRPDDEPFAAFEKVHVAAIPQGFLAWADRLAEHRHCDPALWLSSDGAIWSRLATGDAFVGLAIDRVITVGDEILAITSAGCTKRFLVSKEAHTWQSVSSDESERGETKWPCRAPSRASRRERTASSPSDVATRPNGT